MTENQSLGVEVPGCVEFFKDTEDNDDDAPSFTNIIELLDSTPSTVSGGSSSTVKIVASDNHRMMDLFGELKEIFSTS
ncbi:hypothetical protein A2U01_0077166, partial [Trifolium medium]|nr:hypothetical protein [Trifolium medium]